MSSFEQSSNNEQEVTRVPIPRQEDDEVRPYNLDQSMLLNLKTELSTATPESDIEATRFAEEVLAQIRARYARFMPPRSEKLNDGIEQRIIITDEQSLQDFDDAWLGTETPPLPGLIFEGTYTYLGHAILIADDQHYWHDLAPEEQQDLIQQYGSPETAIKEWGLANRHRDLTHELIHHVGNPELSEAYKEGGATYFTAQILHHMGLKAPAQYLADRRARYFARLMEEQGVLAAAVFFGTQILPSRIQEMEDAYQVVIDTVDDEDLEAWYEEMEPQNDSDHSLKYTHPISPQQVSHAYFDNHGLANDFVKKSLERAIQSKNPHQ